MKKKREYLCNLVVPGFPKTGTSSLHKYLDMHPEICMSSPRKEPHFFSRTDSWLRGSSFHNNLFAGQTGEEKYYGESSTTYCIWRNAISKISNSLDDPRIIILLRDPIERTLSHYRWLWQLGIEKRPFRRALLEDGRTFHPDYDIKGMFMGYLEFSQYEKYVPLWIDKFGDNRVNLVTQQDLQIKPLETLNKVFTFLEIEQLKELPIVGSNKTEKTIGLLSDRGIMIKKIIPAVLRDVIANTKCARMGGYIFGRRKLNPPATVSDEDILWLEEELNTARNFYREVVSPRK